MRSTRRFAFRLSRVFGCTRPDELLDGMSSSQLEEWKAYDHLEPLVDVERIEWCFANLAAIITNLAQSIHCKHPKTVKLRDFLPPWTELPPVEVVKQSPADMKAIFMSIASIQNKGKKPHHNKQRRTRRCPKV